MPIMLSSNWDTLPAKWGSFSPAVQLTALVDTLAEEFVLTVQEQLDLLVYNDPNSKATGRTRRAVKREHGGDFGSPAAGGLTVAIGKKAYKATVHVDPEEFVGMDFYPYYVNRGTRKMMARPFWRNARIIMEVKRRAIQRQYLMDLKVRLRTK